VPELELNSLHNKQCGNTALSKINKNQQSKIDNRIGQFRQNFLKALSVIFHKQKNIFEAMAKLQ
jgi:hypothetical protein